MSFRNFQQLFDSVKDGPPRRAAIIWGDEDHTMAAAAEARRTGGVEPVFIGPPEAMKARWASLGFPGPPAVFPAATPEEAVTAAIGLVHAGEAQLIVKGLAETALVMRQLVRKENGLCQREVLSHLTLMELPSYHKLLGLTDCALLTYPTLEQKKAAIQNALDFYRGVGQQEVKTAVLAAVERVNPKMPEAVDAALLKEAWQKGELPGAVVEGPISYDLAVVRGAAKIKGYQSPVAGDADLLVVPNITAGNLLVKALSYSAGGTTAAVVLGAKVPIVIPSRSSPVRSKATAIKLAAAMTAREGGERTWTSR